ncbi:MAG: TrkH family potassium uptake protein, partial [Bifidobacteriaceae bacterium]|nr:TrkH family potassium uptake protein [Bifidobacteriaceae bacterium]
AIKVGGMGVMTIGALLSLLVSRRLGITQKLLTASETRTSQLGDVRAIVGAVVITSTSCEAVLAVLLTARFAALGGGFGEALWHGVFYGVSTFNNAGFDVTASGLSMHVADWMVLLPIALGVIVGSVGFPVILNIKRNLRRPSHWTLTTKLTLTASAVLLVVAPVLIGLFEWNNPGTFGSMSVGEKILNLFFAGVQTRSGGFATVNVARMHPATLLVQDALMFVGGGSASTAGGIKVTTLAVMVVAVRAEARGDRDAEAFGRRLSPSVLRVAVTVVGVSILIVLAASLVLFAVSSAPTDQILFEVFSAFGTCGLSTGLTAHLPMVGKAAITLLMLVGRLGTMTIAATLAMSNRRRIIRLPEERPIVG